MCGDVCCRKLAAMDETTVSIRLELRLTDDVPEGVAFAGAESGRSFSGWLGLMGAVEALTSQSKEDDDADH
jgi:hypothetical protein